MAGLTRGGPDVIIAPGEMPALHKQIDVETAFDVVIRRLGGKRYSEIKSDTGNLPDNADYVLRNWNVIAELKQLKENLLNTTELTNKIGRLYSAWAQRRIVPVNPPNGVINLRDLPQECALQIITLVRRKIEPIAKKASRQIKATRRDLNMPDAVGLLIIAHDGNQHMLPEAVVNLFSRSLPGAEQHSGIDALLYLSPNVPVVVPGHMGPRLAWLPAQRAGARTLPHGFMEELYREWVNHHSELIGVPMPSFQGYGADTFDALRWWRK